MISRREFLGWMGVVPLFGAAAPARATIAPVPRNSVIVLDEVGPATDAGQLDVVFQWFARRGIPVTCIVECSDEEAGRLTPQHPIAALLKRSYEAVPGLVELCPFVRDLGMLTPYFQARAAFEAQVTLAESLWGETSKTRVTRYRALACADVAQPTAPTGVRASGIRTLLMRPSGKAPVQSQAWENGTLRLMGGARLGSSGDRRNLSVETESEKIYYLSMADFAGGPIKQISTALEALYERVRPQKDNNWLGPILAADVQYRDAYNYRRNVSLHFFTDRAPETDDWKDLDIFRARLASKGFPTTMGPAQPASPEASSGEFWITVEGRGEGTSYSTPLPNSPSANYESAVALWNLDAVGCSGLDAANNLRLPTLLVQDPLSLEALTRNGPGAGDLVIGISGELFARPQYRRVLENVLAQYQHDGFTSVVDLREHVRAVAPQGPYLTHHRRTAGYKNAPASLHRRATASSIDQYLSDAKLAWSYFEKWTHPTTGLCPATVDTTGGRAVQQKAVTMWDVGSNINALIAAYDLGMISKKAFRRAIQKILPNLRGRRSQGRLLPQGWIVTDRIKWGTKDFDGCDAGRLLAALYNLDSHGVAGQVAAPLVASWDLQDVVSDGIIYSVDDGKLVSTYKSHCAHYAAWAFRTWGIECVSPYETFLGRATTDGEMALLEAAGKIGPMGAEPLLLEALELGMSAESAYLADVLFAAQVEEYRKTGTLMCVSESPIDREPWFIYSGLLLDAPRRAWATDTVESLPEHRSAEFVAKNITVSAKAAYLWAAYNPDAYSDRLVGYVREKARTSSGFRSGIYTASGEVTRNTDLNTNAIILQAIAEIARNAA
jgi:hypothetical protein